MSIPEHFRELRRREIEEEQRTLTMVEHGLTDDPWGATLAAVSAGLDEHVPGILYRLWQAGEIESDQLPSAVAWTWIHNRSPQPCLGERRWLRLFKAACEVADDGIVIAWVDGVRIGAELIPTAFEHVIELPTGPIEVWRGAALPSKGRGMSWSVHRDCARGFAEGWANLRRQPTGLYRATVPPRAVLALFGDEREQEVVVNPNMLRGRVELVEQVEPDREEIERRDAQTSALLANLRVALPK